MTFKQVLKRVDEHKKNLIEGFTSKYQVHQLVYYETASEVTAALQREKQLKKWKRAWKIELIEKNNPQWKDLYERFNHPESPALWIPDLRQE